MPDPAAALRESALSNLPPDERTSFLGRKNETAALRLALEEGAPLITVVGTAGIGKTRLARRIGHSIAGSYPGGVWFVPLAAARSEEEIMAAVAAALDVPLAGAKAASHLADAIAGRGKALLILDNFENLVEHAQATLGLWLDRAHEAQFLVTSIVRLGIVGETCFELPPLKPAEAVAMYEERARKVRGDLASAADPGPVGELVARLDHLPLAIELAASRAALLSPKQLLARIDKRLELLHGPRYGRHASLSSAIGCVFDLLSPVERAALTYCAVFRGGFNLAAAEEIIDLWDHRDARPILDVLESLRDKSLLRRAESQADRLDLYESVRAFALRELAESGGLEAAQTRHRAYFLRLGETLAARVFGPEGVEAIRAIAAERENLLAAHQSARIAAPDECARIGLAMLPMLGRQGPAAMEMQVADNAVDATRRCRDDVLLGRALWARAGASIRQGRSSEARRDVDEGLKVARRTDDVGLEGRLLIYSGRMRSFGENRETGRAELKRAIEIHRELGDAHFEGQAQNVLGTVEESVGALEESVQRFQAALALFRSVGDARFEGSVVMNLGVVREREARHADARDLFEEALALFEQTQDRATAADVQVNLGSVHINMGDLERAEAYLEKALSLERTLGNRRFEGLALANLGLLAADRGNLRLARRHFREVLRTFFASGDKRFFAVAQPFAAAVDAALGLVREARTDFAEARRSLEEADDKGMLATLGVLEGFLDLALAREAAERLDLEASARHVEDARRRLASNPPEGVPSEDFPTALRLLGRALEERDGGVLKHAPEMSGELPADALVVAESVEWFSRPGGERVDISRRGPLRLVLQGLVEQRLLAPGAGLDPVRVFEIGWPGEKAVSTAASNRVYAAIRTLRALGLDELLRRHDDGYLLDPTVPMVRFRG